MTFPIFFDTCALYPAAVADLLLRVAETGVFRPHWSGDVLEELQRNLAKIPSAGAAGAERRIRAMTRAFPDASVIGYESLVPGMTCDTKDRHVLAAAVHSGCQVVVTYNLKHFPEASLEPHGLEAVSPDNFLLDQLDLHPAAVLHALRTQISDSRRPALTPASLLASLERSGLPNFAAEVRRKFLGLLMAE